MGIELGNVRPVIDDVTVVEGLIELKAYIEELICYKCIYLFV